MTSYKLLGYITHPLQTNAQKNIGASSSVNRVRIKDGTPKYVDVDVSKGGGH